MNQPKLKGRKRRIDGTVRTVIVKVSQAEHDAIKEQANRYTRGNVSQLIRKAVVTFVPVQGELAADDLDDAC